MRNIAMLAVSALKTISSLISKALSDDSISDEEYSLILLEFQTFTRMKYDLRVKSKMSLEKTGNIETDANEFLRRNNSGVPTSSCSKPRSKSYSKPCSNHVQKKVHNHVQNHVQILVKNHVQTHVQNHVQNHVRKHVQNHVQNRARRNKL